MRPPHAGARARPNRGAAPGVAMWTGAVGVATVPGPCVACDAGAPTPAPTRGGGGGSVTAGPCTGHRGRSRAGGGGGGGDHWAGARLDPCGPDAARSPPARKASMTARPMQRASTSPTGRRAGWAVSSPIPVPGHGAGHPPGASSWQNRTHSGAPCSLPAGGRRERAGATARTSPGPRSLISTPPNLHPRFWSRNASFGARIAHPCGAARLTLPLGVDGRGPRRRTVVHRGPGSFGVHRADPRHETVPPTRRADDGGGWLWCCTAPRHDAR